MARLAIILIGVLASHVVNSAKHLNEENRDLPKSVGNEPKLDDESYSVFENDEVVDGNKETQRQKRWFNNAPYNFPPPYIRPYDTGSDLESSLSYIKLSVQELLSIAKSQPPPPPPYLYPVYVPIYIPQMSCSCSPTNTEEPVKVPGPTIKPPTPTIKPIEPPEPTIKPPVPTTNPNSPNEYVPGLHERFPEMEDENQNWGVVTNNTLPEYDVDDADDGNRPIFLKPVSTTVEGESPYPSVDHGSSQSEENKIERQPVTTARPEPSSNPPLQSVVKPDVCDRAVISCCFGPNKTYRCLQSRGCRERSLSEDPCNHQNLLEAMTRLQNYYG